ncbi:MAG: hypothetical protein J6N21_12285 [Butyrivibrio sp.]|nr:hypothetical protein [Butyrivibrio sp.]
MGEIMYMKRISDMALAFFILALTSVLVGILMLYYGISSCLFNSSHGLGISIMIIDAILHGGVIIISGVVLMALCLFSVFPIISKLKIFILWGISGMAFLLSVACIMGDIIVGTDSISAVVSVFTLIVCGIIFYMLDYARKQMNLKCKNADNILNLLEKAG